MSETRELVAWQGIPLEDMTKEQLIAALRLATRNSDTIRRDYLREADYWREWRKWNRQA